MHFSLQTQKQDENLVDLLRSEQSVTAEIVKLDATKKRFQCTLRLRDKDESEDEEDDKEDEEEESLDLMVKYLKSRSELLSSVIAQHGQSA